ncbi:hypothetical protein N7537_000414 [Penicillium hordei]|uniref:Uncharacterized protein n=1 Tax=Penicillium hordei TaxID=40994 RepID=A0AAD6H7D4_9EURO|nr:uncharacterized protein N7537_000414 [Penicillium hordei]KAJ5615300.1 hypothetical protein N7537_000414 [Penicillium hordei]
MKLGKQVANAEAILGTKIKAILPGGNCTYMYLLSVGPYPTTGLRLKKRRRQDSMENSSGSLAVELVASLSLVFLALIFFLQATRV